MNVNIDKLLLEASFRTTDGTIRLNNKQHIDIIRDVLNEWYPGMEDVINQLITEINPTTKASLTYNAVSFFKAIAAKKQLSDYSFTLPPRSIVISQLKNFVLIKSIIEITNIDNNERVEAMKDIANVMISVKGVTDVKISKGKEMNTSVGFISCRYSGVLYWIAIKGMAKVEAGTSTDTNIKEGLSSLIYQHTNLVATTPQTVRLFINKLITKANYTGESQSVIDSIKSFLTKTQLSDSQLSKLINQNISQARTFQTGYIKWIIDRDKIFGKIRSIAQQKSGLPADKWCPADVYLINPSLAKTLPGKLQEAEQASSPEESIQLLNDLFVQSWGDTSRPIVGISLKLAKAQGGKAKDFLKRFDSSMKLYNLSKDEQGLKGPRLENAINNIRRELGDIAVDDDIFIDYNPPSNIGILKKNVEKAKNKYAALKLYHFLLSQAEPGQAVSMLLAAIAFGMSLSGINPTFFKCTAAPSGEPVSVQTFKAGGVITVYPNGNDIEDSVVTITDTNENAGIYCDLVIEKGDQICDVRLTARSNGMAQATLEIEKISCRKEPVAS